MKTALELFVHAIEHYSGRTPKDCRLAVLHLAHAVELAAKSVLVKHNVPIYLDERRTMTTRGTFDKLGEIWGATPAPHLARVELLIDERNAIQHRYGTIDDVTIDYHMETAFLVMAEVLGRDYGADLHQFVRDAVEEQVWRACRFVKGEHEQRLERAESLALTNPTAALLEAFSWLEEATEAKAKSLDSSVQLLSTLDLLMKFVTRLIQDGALEAPTASGLPDVFRTRNAAVHGSQEPTAEEAGTAINVVRRLAPFLVGHDKDDHFAAAMLESVRDAQKKIQASDFGEPLTETDILRLIARRQLQYAPPKFVGLKMLGTEVSAHQILNSLIERHLLVLYEVANPFNPDHPTSAIRVNVDDADVREALGDGLVAEVQNLDYSGSQETTAAGCSTPSAPSFFGEPLTETDVLRLIARRQLQYAPPKFVGLKMLATEVSAYQMLNSLIERHLVVVYEVANPFNPDHPTSAIRVNVDDADVRQALGDGLVTEVQNLDYNGS
jgi:hypothetical protein